MASITKKKSIRDIVLSSLQSGLMETKNLIEKVNKIRPGTTKQGVYKILRAMKDEEIIVIYKKSVSLNATWITNMNNFFSVAERSYLKNKTGTGNLLDLENGEKIRYEFQSAANTDAFWDHALYILMEAHPGTTWFGYNPHDWFFIARKKTESELRDFINKKGGVYVMTVGSRTALDRHIAKEFDGVRAKYYMRDKPLFLKNNYYVNVVGDFIVEVLIDRKIADRIEDLYKKTKVYSDEAREELQVIINSKGKSKLVISKNKIKAKMLRNKLSKPFHFG